MLEQAARAGAQFVTDRAARQQDEKKQGHADHRPRKRPAKQADEQFAGELKEEQEGECANHALT